MFHEITHNSYKNDLESRNITSPKAHHHITRTIMFEESFVTYLIIDIIFYGYLIAQRLT